jgi:hypothetical protein
MRITVLAGSGLSLLLACTVAASAQSRPTTCAERTRQVKTAQDQLAVLIPQVTAQKARCTGAADDRRRQECMAYGVSLTLQRKQENDLKALTEDPAWRACSASAGGTRYAPASVTPNSSTTPGGGQTSPASSGQNSPSQGSGAGGGGSGSGGPGANPGTRGFGSGSSGGGGMQSGGGGMQTSSSFQGSNCGSSSCSSTPSKGQTIRGGGRRPGPLQTTSHPGSRRPQHTTSHTGSGRPQQHHGGFGSSHLGRPSGRSFSHGRRR